MKILGFGNMERRVCKWVLRDLILIVWRFFLFGGDV
jgi:hypothetical protein